MEHMKHRKPPEKQVTILDIAQKAFVRNGTRSPGRTPMTPESLL